MAPFSNIPANDKEEGGPDRSLHWHILGGNNKHRIGMNSGLCVYEETLPDGSRQSRSILFDAGTLNGDPKAPEDAAIADCDTVIPNLARFLYRRGEEGIISPSEKEIDAIFLTHNHSDHIGAIPFLLLQGYYLPKIYATPYTAKRLEQELSNAGLNPEEWPEIFTIAPGAPVREGPVSVSAFWVSHSTPQSVGFFIETPEGNILLPADFKLDQSVIWGPAFNESQFTKLLRDKSVDLMLLDSTGADRDAVAITEADVRETLHDLMEKHPGKRFIIAVMSGFEENLASVAKVASEHGRTLWVAGAAHELALSALKETGLTLSDSIGSQVDLRILGPGKPARELQEAPPGAAVVVVSGAQGMSNAALTRAVQGTHNALTLDAENDIILFCAPSIPGQEATRHQLFNNLKNKGYTFLTRKDAALYSQAHARLPELIEMAALAKAKTILPSHGDRNLRAACKQEMEKIGQNVISADNGEVLRVTKKGVQRTEPKTLARPPLTGIKTMIGQGWADRAYGMMDTPPEPDKYQPPEPANGNQKKRPPIFNLKPR